MNAVQSVVHAPASVPSDSTPGIHGMVQFTYASGGIEDPVIVVSTKDSALDELLLQQVVSAQIPKPTGPHAEEPHAFELLLDMPTAFESFENSIYAAIDYRKFYPRDGLLGGDMGDTTVDFDYLDGKASNITVTKSSRSGALDKSSIDAISNASLPAAPAYETGKTLHLEVIVCYSLNYVHKCPAGKNVIEVLGTRIMRTTITRGIYK